MPTDEEYIPLGVFRSRSRDAEKTPPSRWMELIDAGAVEGFEKGGRYYIKRNALLPQSQPEQMQLTWARQYHKIRMAAERRGIEFEISKEDLISLLATAGGRCQLTGIELCEKKPASAFRRPWMPKP